MGGAKRSTRSTRSRTPLLYTTFASVDVPLEVVDVLNSARTYEFEIYSNSNQWLRIYDPETYNINLNEIKKKNNRIIQD